MPTQAAGVQFSVKTAEGEDSRLSKRISIAVEEGESPTAFLAPGQFTATWHGQLNIDKRSRVYFSFEGVGSAELFIDGESVLKEDSKLGNSESERLRLNSGLVPIKVVYSSPESGAGHFRLMWRGREFGKEPLPASLLQHEADEKLSQATLVRRGRALFAELKCAQCHDGAKGMPEVSEMAPSLAGVGSRLDEAWMTEWMKAPKSLRAHARMPKVLSDDDDAKHIAAYLKTLTEAPSNVIAGDITAGANKFHDLGCIACHRSEADQDIATWNQAPIDLFNAAHKYSDGALVAFLKHPGKNHASTRMPDFGLDDKEAADLAAFVRSLASKKAILPEKGDAAKGEILVASNHCAQCHDGVEKSTASYVPLAQLSNKVTASSSCLGDTGKGVRYGLNANDKAALTAFLKDQQAVKSLAYFNKAEYASRQFENLNCAACHQMDDDLSGLTKTHSLSAKYIGEVDEAHGHGGNPPDLTFIGEKLRPDWMAQLFSGTLKTKTRPWLKQRMPAFPSRAKNLAEAFPSAYGVINEMSTTTAAEEPGKTLFGMVGGFGCAACHGAAEAKPLAVFEAAGVNLQFSGARLREDYYHRWMRDPRRIDPATIMPKYFVEENVTTLSEPLDGDGHKQMDAIWRWMLELNKQSNK
ncbi:MAG: c-type cytochrome [Rubritalea sp.]|uniref:c-type cytochrome n=1 Tax=Rubritalea sp. TaxID=2109375 RepID=UPI003242A05F